MFMCLVIRATCACHLVIFSEESLFIDPINYRSAQQQCLNLVNARPGHIEHVTLRLYSFLVDFASALLEFAQVAYE